MRHDLSKPMVLEKYPADTEADLRHVDEYETRRRRVRNERILRTAGAVALSVTVVSSRFTLSLEQDIEAGKSEVAGSHSFSHSIYETDNPLFADVATVVSTGVGTRDPSETAHVLTSHQSTGNIYGLEYSNRDIDIDELTETVVARAKRDGIKYLLFDGYSAGGPIDLAIAAKIHEQEADLEVTSVTMNSSPIGTDGLTQKSKQAADMINAVLSVWPDLVYSDKARIFAETVNRHDRYIDSGVLSEDMERFALDLMMHPSKYINDTQHIVDLQKLLHELGSVREKMDDPEVASGVLIAFQTRFLTTYGVAQSLETLSKPSHGHEPPLIFYTRSENPSRDSVVDVPRSEFNLRSIIQKYKNPFLCIWSAVGHANPGEDAREYNEMIAHKINPLLITKIIRSKIARAHTPSNMALPK